MVIAVVPRIALAFLLAAIGSAALAAENPAPAGGTVEVVSSPPGARVSLEGRVRVTGITPFMVSDLPFGRYSIGSGEPGYKASAGDLLIEPHGQVSVDVSMSPKGRLGALSRSIVFPGWGQSYSERPRSQAIYQFGLGVGAVVATAAGINYALDRSDFNNAEQTYRDAIDNGLNAEDEWNRARQAEQAMNRTRDILEYTGYTMAGLWALNMLDSVFLFPAFDKLPAGDHYSLRLRGGAGLRLELARAIP